MSVDSPSEKKQTFCPFPWLWGSFGAVLVLLHLYAAIYPSAVNWGIHLFAYVPSPLRFGAPLLMLLAVIPSIQQTLVGSAGLVVQSFQRIPKVGRLVLTGLLIAGVGVLFWVGRQQTFFLGDGLLAVRNLDAISTASTIPAGFKSAPFTGYILWKLSNLLSGMNVGSPALVAFQVVSIACGLLTLLVLVALVRYIAVDALDRALAYLFIVGGAGSQLSFGYVETYAATYLTVLIFAWLAFAYLGEKLPLVFPSIAYSLMLACHFGMVCMTPALTFLFYHAFTRRRFAPIAVSLAALVITATILLWLSGYTLESFKAVFLDEGPSHLVPFAGKTSGWHAYTLGSLWHAVDVGNLLALLSPFSLFILLVLAPIIIRRSMMKEPQCVFAAIVGFTGMAFVILMNSDIGMSRDWDLFAPYVLWIAIAAVFFWVRAVGMDPLRQRVFVMMLVITSVHTAAYVVVNASEPDSRARFEQLPDNRLWGNGALAYAYEDLWTYHRDRGEYEQASTFVEKCLAADSANARRWANGAQIFQKVGFREKAVRAYERAIGLDPSQAWMYVNLGSEYVNMDRLDEAAELFHKALELDPNISMAAYNLGTLLGGRKHQREKALPYLLRAVATDSSYPPAWQNVGTCLYEMGRYDDMVPYFERYLALAPSDSTFVPWVRGVLATYRQRR